MQIVLKPNDLGDANAIVVMTRNRFEHTRDIYIDDLVVLFAGHKYDSCAMLLANSKRRPNDAKPVNKYPKCLLYNHPVREMVKVK